MRCSIWYLRGIKPFAGMSPEELEKSAKISPLGTVKEGQLIYLPGDPGRSVYLLRSGRVKVAKVSEDNRELTLACLEPDEIFGELDRAEESLRQTVAEPLEEAVIWMISREEFERLLSQRPAPVIKLTKRWGLKTREIKTEVKELVFKDVPDRLVEILLRLANEYGETRSSGTRLRIRLSYQELANLTASTKKAILLALSALRRKGLIDLKRRDILIKDKEGLAKLCSPD
jgi:CRP/FNR family cyclic AMP-dependent transcriptional regulator